MKMNSPFSRLESIIHWIPEMLGDYSSGEFDDKRHILLPMGVRYELEVKEETEKSKIMTGKQQPSTFRLLLTMTIISLYSILTDDEVGGVQGRRHYETLELIEERLATRTT